MVLTAPGLADEQLVEFQHEVGLERFPSQAFPYSSFRHFLYFFFIIFPLYVLLFKAFSSFYIFFAGVLIFFGPLYLGPLAFKWL